MLIEFIRNGKAKQMNAKLARVLEKKGHVRIVDVGVQTVAVEKPAIIEQPVEVPVAESPDLDAMDVDQLRELAEAMNVPVHHRAGVLTIRSAIRAHMA